MRKATENAIKTLLLCDTTVTREERMAVVAAMSGRRAEDAPVGDMSLHEAADYLDMSRTTLWRMCRDGRVACDRRGKKYYVKAAAIAAMKMKKVA